MKYSEKIIKGIDHFLWAATTSELTGISIPNILHNVDKEEPFTFLSGTDIALDGVKEKKDDEITYSTTKEGYEITVKVEVKYNGSNVNNSERGLLNL